MLFHMNITTSISSTYDNITFVRPDCSQSTAITYMSILLSSEKDEQSVIIGWLNGDQWVYHVPTTILIANLGLESVEQFANVVKREARFSTNVRKESMPVVA